MSSNKFPEIENDQDREIHLSVSRRSTGRSPMVHLVMLVGLLALVIWAMVKARDPENWKWMGFEEQDATGEEAEPGDVKVNQANPAKNDSAVSKNQSSLLGKIRDQFSLIKNVDQKEEFDLTSKEAKLRYSFWSQVFERMANQQRLTFQSMLLDRTNAEQQQSKIKMPSGKGENDAAKLLKFLDRQRMAFYATILRETADMDASQAAENKLWSDLLLEMQSNWSVGIKPLMQAYAAGQSCPDHLKKAREQMHRLWQQVAWDAIEDYAVSSLSAERCAWDLALHQLSTDQEFANGSATVNTIDLMAQPEVYRGEPVLIKGQLLRGESIKSNNPYVKNFRYNRLWIKPEGLSQTPYCIYSLNVPEGFPELQATATEFNHAISLEGIFFKVMVYTANDDNGASCPLILANTFICSVGNKINSQEPGSEFTSEPKGSFQGLYIAVLSILVVGAGIWCFAIWMERSPQRTDSKGKSARVQNTMDDLEKRDDILDVHQRLSKLEQSDET